MNVTLRQPMTTEQFLEWEDRQELRYEFDGIAPRAMIGGTASHSSISVNLTSALRAHLRGTLCRAYNSDLKIIVASGRVRYPDAFVACTPVAADAKWVTEPVVVFEVVSKSTMNEDMVVKNAEYRATPSIHHYIILQQTHPGATMFSRKGGDWVAEMFVGVEATLSLPAIGIDLPLAEIYADIDLATINAAAPL